MTVVGFVCLFLTYVRQDESLKMLSYVISERTLSCYENMKTLFYIDLWFLLPLLTV